MNLEIRGSLRILTSNFGYLIHNKTTDTYGTKFYLGIHANIEDFEEVRDESIDINVANKMIELEEKEKSLNKIGKIVANQVTDDIVALTIQEFYDEFQVGIAYKVGQYINYEGVLYKVLTDHTSQDTWTPNATPSLFAKVLIDPTSETILEWEQPNSTNPYMKGDKVKYEGVIYVSIVDNNVWKPTEYGWQLEG